jgi:hypothetical protein
MEQWGSLMCVGLGLRDSYGILTKAQNLAVQPM